MIFEKGLQDPSNEIKVAAFKTLTIFLSSIVEEKSMKNFNNVLRTLLDKAIELVKYDQESGVTALESLNELVETHPKFIKPIFDNLLMVYTEVMETEQLLVNLRTTAMAGIFVLCHEHHTLVRKAKYFKTNMVNAYMKMLAEVREEQTEEWAGELIDEVISKNDVSMSTEEHLGQIANELGNKFMLPLFVPLIRQGLESGEVRYQHAGLTALALLIENCHPSFKGELQNMVGLMLPMMQSNHPRIIYDSLVVMGYMSTEFNPDIQINFGGMVLEFVCKALAHPLLKVQYKAALCLVNFEQGLADHPEVKVMEPFLGRVLGELARIFEQSMSTSNYIMLEAALQSISSIASINNFREYYGTFMPGMAKIVEMVTPDTPQKINIKNKAIEAMGDLLTSVKEAPEIFLPECSSLMKSLLGLEQQVAADDSLHKALFTVYENVVEILKGEFSAYSDLVFQFAHAAAIRKIDFQIIDELDTEKNQKTANHKYVKIKLDLKIDGMKNFVLNTDTFEQKLAASRLLSAMTEHMGEAFLPYVERMMGVVEEVIVTKHSKEMRGNMIDCCKFMVLDGRTPEEKAAILVRVHPHLMRGLTEAVRVRDHEEVSSLTEAFSLVMPFMTPDMANKLPEMMMAVLTLVRDLSKQIEHIYSEKEKDDDVNEEMMGEIEDVE